jgi:hypothetical protein
VRGSCDRAVEREDFTESKVGPELVIQEDGDSARASNC